MTGQLWEGLAGEFADETFLFHSKRFFKSSFSISFGCNHTQLQNGLAQSLNHSASPLFDLILYVRLSNCKSSFHSLEADGRDVPPYWTTIVLLFFAIAFFWCP